MEKFKGTTGKWTALKNNSYWEVNNSCDYEDESIKMSINVMLNIINAPIDSISLSEESEANAKLIAAAPELLEGCIHALEMCKEIVMPTENDLMIMRGRLVLVINKALK